MAGRLPRVRPESDHGIHGIGMWGSLARKGATDRGTSREEDAVVRAANLERMAMLLRLLAPSPCTSVHASCMQICASSSLAFRGFTSQAQPLAAQQSTAAQGPGEPSTSGRHAVGEVKPELVDQILSTVNMNHRDRIKMEKKALMQGLQRHASDVGSPEVTVAVWTHRMREQVKQFYVHPKNPIQMREFEIIMHKRRRLLAYLRDANFPAYASCIQQLGLADVFGRVTSADRYPTGKAHSDPEGATDIVRRHRFSLHRKYSVKKTSQWKRLLPQLQVQDPNLPKPPARMVSGSVQRLNPEGPARQ